MSHEVGTINSFSARERSERRAKLIQRLDWAMLAISVAAVLLVIWMWGFGAGMSYSDKLDVWASEVHAQ